MRDNGNGLHHITTEMNSSSHLYCYSLMKYASQTNGNVNNTSYVGSEFAYDVLLHTAHVYQVL